MSVARNTRKPETVKADLASRRAAAEKRARAQIEVLHAEVFLRQCKDTSEALERLQMRAPLSFTTLADLLAPQPWAIDNGVVLGHLLTMEEGAYQTAINADAFDAVSLDDALKMAWADSDELDAWTAVYIEALRSLADQAEGNARSFREREELRKGGGSEGEPGSGRRRGL